MGERDLTHKSELESFLEETQKHADAWSDDVEQMRVFLEINMPTARSCTARLEAVAHELRIRALTINTLIKQKEDLQKELAKWKKT